VNEPLTTAEIKELLQQPPAWLVTERATQAEVRAEQIRDKENKAEKAAKKERAARGAAQRAAHRGE
jgi:thiamine monophosphate synthase